MKIRIFGSDDCDRCETLLRELDIAEMAYEFVDALVDETQDLCDEFDVDFLPHVQLLNDTGEVVFNHIGRVSPDELQKVLVSFNASK